MGGNLDLFYIKFNSLTLEKYDIYLILEKPSI